MTTTADYVTRTRDRYLTQGVREERNLLGADIDAAATTVTFTYALGGISRGATISLGFETMYVWDIAGGNAIVQRGADGSTASSHVAGELVRVQPRFTDSLILGGINDALSEAWSLGLYRVDAEEVVWDARWGGYGLADAEDSIPIIVETQGSQPGEWGRVDDWRLGRTQNIGDFPSGEALFFDRWDVNVISGKPIRVHYRRPFGQTTSVDTNLESTTGWRSAWRELLEVSAAMSVLAGREVGRNLTEAQGPTRRAEEVGQGAQVQSLRPLAMRQTARLAGARKDLLRLYGERRAR